jgi:hypothetical protein
MKKYYLSALCVCLSLGLFAQAEKKDELIKKNWNFGALPTITFDTDLGFQYGALVNLFDYGDGSRYPKYNQSLYFEVSRFTKGSGINRFYYDSDRLIKGLQTSADLSYLSDQAYDFFGFNGYDAVYQPDWIDDAQPANIYKTRMFYKYDRKLFRFKVDLQGKLIGDHFRWTSGFNLQNFKIGSVNLDKLNKGKSGSDVLPAVDGLYEKYQQWGIISAKEANGGFVPTIKGGIVYDTRDNRPNPMKGVWMEAVLEGAPEFLGSESSFAKLSLIHREYFTLVPKTLSLVYRVAYQTTVAGHTPFYYQSQVITSVLTGALSEGLGGAKTMRGILRNRVVGDGFLYGNVEARWKVVRFQWIKNNFYLGLNAFTDFGKVTKTIDTNFKYSGATGYYSFDPEYNKIDAEKFHYSYGAGLRVVMNENFVIAADYGMTPNVQDGTSGMYIGLNYLF